MSLGTAEVGVFDARVGSFAAGVTADLFRLAADTGIGTKVDAGLGGGAAVFADAWSLTDITAQSDLRV